MEQVVSQSCALLKDTAQDWKLRVAAMKRLRVDVLPNARVGGIRALVPCLARQVSDGRSQVVVEACATISETCRLLGGEQGFDPYADAFVKCLLPLVSLFFKLPFDSKRRLRGCSSLDYKRPGGRGALGTIHTILPH